MGVLTAFAAGMVNIASLLIFFAFSSNLTGHYAILASEIVLGNYHQVAVVFGWVFLFFFGSFLSNMIVIHFNHKSKYLAHSTPIAVEIICLVAVGFYGQHFYQETLMETEILLALIIFAMGLQNGLTASISNSAVKTTHLTGTTTDLGVLFAMFTKPKYRNNKQLRGKASLLSSIAGAYVTGAISAGFIYIQMGFRLFYIVSICLVIVIIYDFYKISLIRYVNSNRFKKLNESS